MTSIESNPYLEEISHRNILLRCLDSQTQKTQKPTNLPFESFELTILGGFSFFLGAPQHSELELRKSYPQVVTFCDNLESVIKAPCCTHILEGANVVSSPQSFTASMLEIVLNCSSASARMSAKKAAPGGV